MPILTQIIEHYQDCYFIPRECDTLKTHTFEVMFQFIFLPRELTYSDQSTQQNYR